MFAMTTTILTMSLTGMLGVAADQPVELGNVSWGRNLDAAKATSRASGRPILLLFQEVPGCHGCVTFGNEPLSHPLIVEAMETEFVPVAIHNNVPGYDETVLKAYDEPAWNYPVMRLLDAEGTDIIPRQDRIYSIHGVARRLVTALEAADRDVPAYLAVLADETAPSLELATFSMHCYWEGEGKLGALDGVRTTRSGWRNGEEVVEIRFDSVVVTYEALLRHAKREHCLRTAFASSPEQSRIASGMGHDRIDGSKAMTRPAKPSDQKHTLRRTALRYVPLTPGQQTKINAALHTGTDVRPWMSPRQIRLATAIDAILEHTPDAFRGLDVPDHGTDLSAYQVALTALLRAATSAVGSDG